ncbi:MAG: elongation factor Ts [Ruminococcaceae bacterium]|nr:elongation factor Ts [Oscillospiraceae bacterium]MBQ2781053.1 elongation factor Ts [Clostridia bacterium]
MAFTAKDVVALRERTGVGMMDCKKALIESDGDMEKAVDILREKGLAKQAKKASRVAAEGVAFATVDADKKVGVLVEVNSETDFAAKSDKFIAFVNLVAQTIIDANPADVDALMATTTATGDTLADVLRDQVMVIGENLSVRRFVRYEGDCVSYVHGGGRIGVLVKFEADAAASGSQALVDCGKDVAMQIAALNGTYLDKSTVPAADIEREKEVQLALIKNDPKNANKPENILEKMIAGKMNKFYEENCVMQQAFVKNGDISVAQYVEDCAKSVGGEMKVIEFTRFEKGEGIAKREDDFASEVASMMK